MRSMTDLYKVLLSKTRNLVYFGDSFEVRQDEFLKAEFAVSFKVADEGSVSNLFVEMEDGGKCLEFLETTDLSLYESLAVKVNFENELEDVVSVSDVDKAVSKHGFYRQESLISDTDIGISVYSRLKHRDVFLSYTNATTNGPGRVVSGLISGLRNIGVEITNESNNLGILQATNHLMHRDGRNVVAGPNICVLPSEMPNLISGLKTYVVPSKWTFDIYSNSFKELKKENQQFVMPTLKYWMAGVDSDHWKPSSTIKDYHNCFIYFKNRSEQELNIVTKVFENLGMNVSVIRYGSYAPAELKSVCDCSSFCVLLDGTESQGIAVMEILSMNVPIFVLDKTTWTYSDGRTFPATSVPLFDSRCGRVVSGHLSKGQIDDFLRNLWTFKPRQFILESFTLNQAAGKYMECFND